MLSRSDISHHSFMSSALNLARDGLKSGQAPFGAVIVRDREVLSADHNRVRQPRDIAAHAEIQAIRLACHKLETLDLSGCTLYSTCEPCPMCFGAICWSGIRRIVFGASIADAEQTGLKQLRYVPKELVSMGSDAIEIVAGVMRDESKALLSEFARIQRDAP